MAVKNRNKRVEDILKVAVARRKTCVVVGLLLLGPLMALAEEFPTIPDYGAVIPAEGAVTWSTHAGCVVNVIHFDLASGHNVPVGTVSASLVTFGFDASCRVLDVSQLPAGLVSGNPSGNHAAIARAPAVSVSLSTLLGRVEFAYATSVDVTLEAFDAGGKCSRRYHAEDRE